MSERQPADSPRPGGGAQRSSLTIQNGSSAILLVIGLVTAAYLLFRILHVLTAVVMATAIDKLVAAMQARGVPRAAGIV